MQLPKRVFSSVILGLTIFVSCKKTTDRAVPATSLNVINAAPLISNAKVTTPNANGYYSQLVGVNYSSNAVFLVPAGNAAISIASVDDTVKPFYNTLLKSDPGDVYSLFIASGNSSDILLHKDQIPFYSDEQFGVRFINLCQHSSAVSVQLITSPTINEFNSVAYQGISDFKTYPAPSINSPSYTFQITDGQGNILATSPVLSGATYTHRNITLVLNGYADSTGANGPGTFVVPNY